MNQHHRVVNKERLVFMTVNKLQDEIRKARIVCNDKGIRSEHCAAAWDAVDELQSELAHQRAERVLKTAFDEFCDEYPEARDVRMFDTWCSG